MNKKDYVEASIAEDLYQDDSGAYKRIDKELERESIYCDSEGLYHPKS